MSKASTGQAPEEGGLKERLLLNILDQVPFEGWTEAAVRLGAEEAGSKAEIAQLYFPKWPLDGIAAFVHWADQQMLDAAQDADLPSMKIRERITWLVRTRLEQMALHKEAVRRASGILALPQNASLNLKLLGSTVDAMWRAAGDRSTDYNFYSKRLILSGVYGSTLLVWLNDDTPDQEETWQFLDRRIGNVMSFEKAKARVLKSPVKPPNLARFLGRLRYPVG